MQTQSQIQHFTHPDFGSLEVITLCGKPYFPATECAALLGYRNANDAVRRHCKGVVKHDLPSTSGIQSYNFIPEGDLYRLIIRSKLPAAVRFEAWVCDEVLPSLRQHGFYVTQELLNKAQYYDAILQAEHVLPVSIIAKDYGMSAVAFNKMLHALGVQYRMGETWLLYGKYAAHGYTVTKTYVFGEHICIHTYWTQKGRAFLYELLAWYGIGVPANACICGEEETQTDWSEYPPTRRM
ncbi:MAG: phage antirepressor KilAC domain-containing protein [Oscillospiraceae bacterium]|nr:phage antirepressor KilAC domain-containing protein [Oscillospiraceae bacterium]